MYCKNCNIEHNGLFGTGIFCSHKCVAAHAGKSKKNKPYGEKITYCNDCKCEIIIPSNQSINLIRRCNLCKDEFNKIKPVKIGKPSICEKCNIEHDGLYGSGRFCSSICSRSFSTKEKRAEINKKISETYRSKIESKSFLIKNNNLLKFKKIKLYNNSFYIKKCICCNKMYLTFKLKQIYCSQLCSRKSSDHSAMGRLGGLKSAKIQSENRRSKNEISFANLCIEYFKNVLTNVNMFNGWDADIIIPELKIAILWNGIWHHKKITKKHSLLQVQNRDKIKIKEIELFGYKPYIIDDLGRNDSDFVNEKFQEFIKFINI